MNGFIDIKIIRITILLTFLMLSVNGFSQEGALAADTLFFEPVVAEQPYIEQIEKKEFNSNLWKKLSDEHDYDALSKKKIKESTGPSFSIGSLQAFQPLFYIIIVVVLVLIIVKLLGNSVFSKEKKFKINAVKSEDLANKIHEVDLNEILKEALAQQDFKMAIRIYYLIIIKLLSETGKINWKKDKTNWEYIQEMKTNPGYDTFRTITATFERVWYGNSFLEESVYEQMVVQFQDFKASINNQ